ncbi:MAG TPA: type IV pilin protein [Pseudoduganella sp.]
MNAQNAGFTLIEMVAAAAIAILLATAAMPVYQQAVISSKRAEAQSLMEELMQQQERHFSQFNTYIAFSSVATDPEARQFRWWSGRSPPRSAYELEGKACDGDDIRNCIQLVAKPGTALVDSHFQDRQCEQLTLTSTGQRSATGPATSCWR